jgi:drug/metabolite transporter superfamily protein YnfA
MKHPLRTVILVLIGAVLLIVAGWIVTVVLFKSGGRAEEPYRPALQLSR